MFDDSETTCKFRWQGETENPKLVLREEAENELTRPSSLVLFFVTSPMVISACETDKRWM